MHKCKMWVSCGPSNMSQATGHLSLSLSLEREPPNNGPLHSPWLRKGLSGSRSRGVSGSCERLRDDEIFMWGGALLRKPRNTSKRTENITSGAGRQKRRPCSSLEPHPPPPPSSFLFSVLQKMACSVGHMAWFLDVPIKASSCNIHDTHIDSTVNQD